MTAFIFWLFQIPSKSSKTLTDKENMGLTGNISVPIFELIQGCYEKEKRSKQSFNVFGIAVLFQVFVSVSVFHLYPKYLEVFHKIDNASTLRLHV